MQIRPLLVLTLLLGTGCSSPNAGVGLSYSPRATAPVGSAAAASSAPQAPAIEWEDGLSLTEALLLADVQNPTLAAARARIGHGQARIVHAETWRYNPTLELEGIWDLGVEGEYDLSVGITQRFEIAGQRGVRTSAAQADLEAVRAEVEDARRRLGSEVTQAYLEALFTEHMLDLARAAEIPAAALLDIALARRRAGDIPEVQLNLVQLERQEAAAVTQVAGRRVELAKQRLRALLGEPRSRALELTTEYSLDRRRLAEDWLVQLALEHRPDLRAARERARARELRIDLEERSRWPDVTFGVHGTKDVGVIHAGIKDLTDRDMRYGIDLEIELPFLNRRQGQILEAIAQLTEGQADVRAAEIHIAAEVAQALTQLELGREQVTAYQELLQRSRLNLDKTQEAYQIGEVGTLEVLKAQEEFNEMSQSYERARFQAASALALLSAAVDFRGGPAPAPRAGSQGGAGNEGGGGPR